MSFGPGPTAFGPISVSIRPGPESVRVSWRGEWRSRPQCNRGEIAGRKAMTLVDTGDGEVEVPRAPETSALPPSTRSIPVT